MTGVSFWQSNSIDGHLELTNATRSLTPFSRFFCAYIPCSKVHVPIGFHHYVAAYTTHSLDGKE